jgi:hypothetical protein
MQFVRARPDGPALRTVVRSAVRLYRLCAPLPMQTLLQLQHVALHVILSQKAPRKCVIDRSPINKEGALYLSQMLLMRVSADAQVLWAVVRSTVRLYTSCAIVASG